MYQVVVNLEQRGGLKRDYEVGTYDTLPAARAALDEWLEPYHLVCYRTDDLGSTITKLIVCYTAGNRAYNAVAYIHIKEDGA